MTTPACHVWPVPDRLPVSLSRATRIVFMLNWWQRGRCAICGHTTYVELDHDHQTDAVRGLLCRPCNVREGFDKRGIGDSPLLFAAYRQRPPAVILGLRGRYGWWTGDLDDWPDGCAVPSWKLSERMAQARLAASGNGDPVAAAEYLLYVEVRRGMM